jgi:heavy metal sensor kinase
MNTRSIRFRLSAWHALLFTAVFAVLGGLLYVRLKNYLYDGLLETQARRARQIAGTLLANTTTTGEPYVARQIESLYAPELGDRFIRVTRADGSTLYASGAPNDQSFVPGEVGRPPEGRGPEFTRLEKMPQGPPMLIAAFRAAGTGGPYLVEVGTSSEPVDRLARHLLVLLGLGIPLVVAVAAAGGYILVRRALAPVDQITAKAESITLHSLSERLPVSSTGDELERLSVALNLMITRLDDAFGNSRRFVADASHELRTPLTVIQGELESLSAEPGLAPELRERVGSTLEEVERLGKIVQQLFALSRLDAGEAQAEWVRVDLATLAASTCDQMLLLAEDRRITMTHGTEGDVPVMGDRARLKQVAVNLIDNAVKYTAPGGSVHLRTYREGPSAVLEVADTGIGIPAPSLPLIFERFYRVGREGGYPEGGAGLGLSIVRSICTAHGGRVEADSSVGTGSRFRVILPLAPS